MNLKMRIEGILSFIGPQTRDEIKAKLIDIYGMEESQLEPTLSKTLSEMMLSILEKKNDLYFLKETV